MTTLTILQDRPWNDPGPRRGKAAYSEEVAARPTLRAIILDFSAVDFLDATAAQALVDLRVALNRYADPDVVEFHFAGVANAWTRRALVASGFGADSQSSINADVSDEKAGVYSPLIGVAASTGAAPAPVGGVPDAKSKEVDIEAAAAAKSASQVATTGATSRFVPIYGVNRPFFHVDIETALDSVLRSIERRGSGSE
jgi:sodium-independent sulfate anion transporter 11